MTRLAGKEAQLLLTYFLAFCQVDGKLTDNKKSMIEVIEISDNLFYINEIIKTLVTASELNITHKAFNEKIIKDIDFINENLSEIATLLFESPRKRTLILHLRTLLKSSSAFKTALEIIETSHNFRKEEEELKKLLGLTALEQEEMIQFIVNFIDDLEVAENSSVFITNEEMSLLFEEN